MGFVPLYDTSNYFSKNSEVEPKYVCSWCGYITKNRDHRKCPKCGIKVKRANKRKKSAVTKRKRKIVFERDGNQCVNIYCISKENPEFAGGIEVISPLTIDHIVPLVRGGHSKEDNLQTLCKKCNSAKAAKVINYRIMQTDLTRNQNEVLAYLDGKRRVGNPNFISPTEIGHDVRGIVRYDEVPKRVSFGQAAGKLQARKGSLNYELLEIEDKTKGYVVVMVDKPVYARSSWASPICKSLVKKNFVQRNEKGHYRINWEITYY